MISFIIISCLLFLGFVFFFKAPSLQKQGPFKPSSVSVIIPARNEEKNLPNLLSSLLESHFLPQEIIVVDDESTDETAKIASAFGAQVLQISKKPAHWNGKSYALFQGAQKAQGEFLLFLDADTTVSPDFIQHLLLSYQQQPGLISVQPSHKTQESHEQFAPLLNLLVVGGLGDFGLFEKGQQAFGAYGPCQLIPRTDYFAVGGHEAIQEVAVEDLAMEALFKNHGISTYNYLGGKDLSFRMYPNGYGEMLAGFSKSFATGAAHTPRWKLLFSILWITGLISATQVLFTGALGWFSFVPYLMAVAQLKFFFQQVGRFKSWAHWLFPLPLGYFFLVYSHSILYTFWFKKNTWRGRILQET